MNFDVYHWGSTDVARPPNAHPWHETGYRGLVLVLVPGTWALDGPALRALLRSCRQQVGPELALQVTLRTSRAGIGQLARADDDAEWARVLDHARHLAEACVEIGAEGFLLDTENYGVRWEDHPRLPERGAALARALRSVAPELVLGHVTVHRLTGPHSAYLPFMAGYYGVANEVPGGAFWSEDTYSRFGDAPFYASEARRLWDVPLVPGCIYDDTALETPEHREEFAARLAERMRFGDGRVWTYRGEELPLYPGSSNPFRYYPQAREHLAEAFGRARVLASQPEPEPEPVPEPKPEKRKRPGRKKGRGRRRPQRRPS